MRFACVFIIVVGLYTPAFAGDSPIGQIDQRIRDGDVKLDN